MANSVIMIAYSFPPEGCAGAHRPLRFVRQLARTGWHTTVISADRLRHNRREILRIALARGRDFVSVRRYHLRE